jgi:polyisoprenyl-teichoic acid--peptidoglycan teichoic acid transferase
MSSNPPQPTPQKKKKRGLHLKWRKPILALALFTLGFLLIACVLLEQGTNTSSQGPSALIVWAPPDATATVTPFQPVPPTPTYIITDIPTPQVKEITLEPTPVGVQPPVAKSWDDYPGPIVWPDIDIPAPTGLLEQPSGQTNILLLGSDQRPSDGGFRTDTIILVTLNSELGTVNVTTFPRDLYVYIPGYTVQRINTAFAFGDFEGLATTFEYNFGVHPDHYVLINFWSFVDIVDSLGGINVNVERTFTDHRDGYGDYTVYAGNVHMDGPTVLWYVRARYTTSDFDRGRRQQEVLEAIGDRLLSLDALTRAPELYDIYRNNVTTDLSLNDVVSMLPLAAKLTDTSRIHRFAIGPGQVYDWTNYSGAMVLVPIREAVLEVMYQVLNSP